MVAHLVGRTTAVALLAALISVGAANGATDTLPDAGTASATPYQQVPEKLDINRATAEQLQKVPGIGETLAKRIVDFRGEHGPFEKIDDLLNVRGIGVRSLEKLRSYLTVKKSKSRAAGATS